MTTEEHIQLHNQMIVSIERNLSALVEAQQKSEQEIAGLQGAIISLAQVVDRGLGLVQELAARQLQADDRQVQADERQRRLDERMDRLAESLQRFLDSQSRRNGGE